MRAGLVVVPPCSRPSTGADVRRVAVVDIGTNSVLLLVAARDGADALRALVDESTVTRLGAGVDRSRRLARAPIDQTLACLQRYAHRSQQEHATEIVAVATSALRDATNGSTFLDEAERLLGARPLVLSGQDEARLTCEGALGGLALAPGEVTVFDLGGGSAEIIEASSGADGQVTLHAMQSVDLGCVRATERHLRGDPPRPEELERLRDEARVLLAGVSATPMARVVAVGGTATSLGALVGDVVPYDHARIHGFVLSRRALARAIERLRALPLEERRKLAALEPRRADVIVAGAVLLDEIAAALGADELQVSDRGLRWGVAERRVSGRPVAG